MDVSAFDRVKSGMEELDTVLDNIRIGDNVVWQVDEIDDYFYFVDKFVKNAKTENRKIVYIRFADHKELVEEGENVKIYRFSALEGFESFVGYIHSIIEKEGLFTYYVFDSLSYIVDIWATDLMLGNFFFVTCPFLFELNTIAYFAIIRNNHSFETIARIRDTTQILIDIYKYDNRIYIHPIKVWNRYSPTMFFPHVKEENTLRPITSSSDANDFFYHISKNKYDIAERKLDFWDKIFLSAKTLHSKMNKTDFDVNEELQMQKKLCGIVIGKEKEILELAYKYLAIEDILEIKERLIGSGYIGGKAVGMIIARKILTKEKKEYFNKYLEPHDSFYIGSDVFYSYLISNKCWKLRMEQKKPEKYFESAKVLRENILAGQFNHEIKEQFKRMLEHYGQSPIIVRSSSLLEDGYGNAFAGKYESIFCVNQGTPEERYREFENAVKTVYASTMNEDALAYRKQRKLDDKDEQMALLVQRVSGAYYKNYYFPEVAGVAMSYNMYVWNDYMSPDAGMVRLVFGLGTRAVDRVEDDYPRIIALDYPLSQPISGIEDVRDYSQKYLDLMDVTENCFKTLDFNKLLSEIEYKNTHYIAVKDYEITARMRELGITNKEAWLITFEKLIKETEFIELLKTILNLLEKEYKNPIDIEFTINFTANMSLKLNLLQCRPMQTQGAAKHVLIPENINEENVIFRTAGRFMGSNNSQIIKRVIYVDAENYCKLIYNKKFEAARVIGMLNRIFNNREDMPVMLIGPGRWGTTLPSLGVPVSFSEINNISVLVEMSYENGTINPDISFGSHFFQDLVETNIFYSAIFSEDPATYFNKEWFSRNKNILNEILPEKSEFEDVVKVYDVSEHDFKIIADISSQKVICFINKR